MSANASPATQVQCQCPECAGVVPFTRAPLAGEVVRCSECAVELEVTAINPLTLTLAPEVEEDWGE